MPVKADQRARRPGDSHRPKATARRAWPGSGIARARMRMLHRSGPGPRSWRVGAQNRKRGVTRRNPLDTPGDTLYR
jgi:hypothetical protein